jgi:hypothetical protein
MGRERVIDLEHFMLVACGFCLVARFGPVTVVDGLDWIGWVANVAPVWHSLGADTACCLAPVVVFDAICLCLSFCATRTDVPSHPHAASLQPPVSPLEPLHTTLVQDSSSMVAQALSTVKRRRSRLPCVYLGVCVHRICHERGKCCADCADDHDPRVMPMLRMLRLAPRPCPPRPPQPPPCARTEFILVGTCRL